MKSRARGTSRRLLLFISAAAGLLVMSAPAGAGVRFRATQGALGGFANIGGPKQGQSESEFTLGFAELLSRKFKLEEGAVLKSDGSWQTVVGWEFDFGEGR